MLNILFESESVLAFDKPIGLASIQERIQDHETVSCLHHLAEKQVGSKLFIVHRIDKDVSGVVLFARNKEVHRMLSMAFQERLVQKRYLALVYGTGIQPTFEIELPLRIFGSGRVAVDNKDGKPSYTTGELLSANQEYSLVHVSPKTGRKHQLRAHLYAIGHAIVGDKMYGKTHAANAARMMLHASNIQVTLGSERLNISSPVPQLFLEECVRLGVTQPERSF